MGLIVIFSLKEYKRALKYQKDLKIILLELEEITKKLNTHKHYTGVFRILNSIKEEETLLKLHLDKINTTISTKGKLND